MCKGTLLLDLSSRLLQVRAFDHNAGLLMWTQRTSFVNESNNDKNHWTNVFHQLYFE